MRGTTKVERVFAERSVEDVRPLSTLFRRISSRCCGSPADLLGSKAGFASRTQALADEVDNGVDLLGGSCTKGGYLRSKSSLILSSIAHVRGPSHDV
jgi:hypothetical protein